MRAVQLVEWQAQPELREVPRPVPGPGEVLLQETPMMVGAMSETLRAATVMQTPQGRLGRPEEIAATIAFLVSDDASYFVGETVSPNGGMVTT
jgi:NAD(P)-dependent dehydrogenase (short-subunit alcohol dehydrogenase family)